MKAENEICVGVCSCDVQKYVIMRGIGAEWMATTTSKVWYMEFNVPKLQIGCERRLT